MQEADYNTFMKTLSFVSGFIFVLLLTSACSFNKKRFPNRVHVAIGSIPSTMDPRFALDAEGMKIGNLIFQSLVKIGPDMNVQGDAAQSWKLKEFKNKFYLSFQLKPELKFSNGKPVQCEDYLFSIQEYKAKSSPFSSAFANIIDQKCEPGKLTLVFKTYSEKVLNSDLPVLKILPKKIVSQVGQDFKSHLVGSGPFQLVSQDETSLVLKPNKEFSKPPQIKSLEFKVIKDDFTRFLKMYRGDLDLAVSSLPKNKISSLKKLDFLKVIRKPGLKMTYILVNFKNDLLKKYQYRKMIFQSLDRKEIIKYKLEGLAEEATSILPPANPYHNSHLKPILPKADDRLREKVLDSQAATKILVLKTSNSREAVENGKLIVNQMRKAGFRVRHETYEWGTYYKDIKDGQFDLATMTWVGAYDPDIYRIALSSKEFPPSGRNRGYYKNSNFDQLVQKGAKELDPKKRHEFYQKAQKIAVKDLAILPLWYEDTITVVHKRLKNYKASLNGDYSGLVHAKLSSTKTN